MRFICMQYQNSGQLVVEWNQRKEIKETKEFNMRYSISYAKYPRDELCVKSYVKYSVNCPGLACERCDPCIF